MTRSIATGVFLGLLLLSGCSRHSTPHSQGSQPATNKDCGPRALSLALQALGVPPSLETLTKRAGTNTEGTSLLGLQRAAESAGLSATGVQLNQAALLRLDTPAVAWWDGDHFVAVLAVKPYVTIHDPRESRPHVVSVAEVLARSGGYFLVITRKSRERK